MTTEVWIFDPVTPDFLYKVNQILGTDIFCSGLSWEKEGKLLVAGGALNASPHEPTATYRFSPRALGPAGVTSCSLPGVIRGNPWTGVGLMSLPRYYPGLIETPREKIDPNGTTPIAGGSTIVIGGAPTALTVQEDGNEWWQFMEPYPTTAWSRTFYPDPLLPFPLQPEGATQFNPDATHGTPPPPNEMYFQRSLTPTNFASYAKVKFDSYPRAFFLSNLGAFPNPFAHNLFVAGDIDTQSPTEGPSIPNTQGDSTVLRLKYSGTSNTSAELWKGPDADSLSVSNDRQYGGSAFFHTLAGKNRVLVIGGMQDTTPIGSTRNWIIVSDVQEYSPGINPVSMSYGGTGQWITKTVGAQTPRVFNTAVIDPLGEIVLMGGATSVNSGGSPLVNEYRPEIYTPGNAGATSGATSTMMSTKPNAPGSNPPTPFARNYHNWSILLPDGRIVNGGGGWAGGPDPRFSAEIFSPPYMTYSNRPEIFSIEVAGQETENIEFSMALSPHSSEFLVTVDHLNATDRMIDQVILLRPGAITHNFDSDQRYIELEFNLQPWGPNGQGVQVFAPADDLGPPGFYMLFVIEKNTTTSTRGPSSARFIKLQ